jgi:hypothetical protein
MDSPRIGHGCGHGAILEGQAEKGREAVLGVDKQNYRPDFQEYIYRRIEQRIPENIPEYKNTPTRAQLLLCYQKRYQAENGPGSGI